MMHSRRRERRVIRVSGLRALESTSALNRKPAPSEKPSALSVDAWNSAVGPSATARNAQRPSGSTFSVSQHASRYTSSPTKRMTIVTGMIGRSRKRQAMPATTACGKNITGG
jgi:hypothetical protein